MHFFTNRILHLIILLVGISTLNFFLFHLSPGDPTNLYFGPKTNKEDLAALRHKLGYDQPWYLQLKTWGTNLLQGNLGYSWAKHRPVAEILKEAIPATVQLTALALMVNLLLGCLVGTVAGVYSRHWWGRGVDYVTLGIYSIPTFLLALILIFVFCLKLRWLPPSQMSSFVGGSLQNWDFIWDRIRHLILPVSVLGLTGAAATSRYVRAQMQIVLGQNFITMALAKGLPKYRVYAVHALKNALVPVATLLGLYFPILLGGALIVEVIFAWPGIGRLTYEAILAKDYPVIMAVNFIAAVMVVAGNLVSDLLYRFLDPRIQLGHQKYDLKN